MKLNKSILGSTLIIVLLFSACSQAKYGHMTRRVKADVVAKKTELPRKVETETKANKSLSEALVVEQAPSVLPSNEVQEIVLEDNLDKSQEVTSKENTALFNKKEVNKAKQANLPQALNKKLNEFSQKTSISQGVKKLEKLKVDKTNSDSSLLRLVLIIILILLIISLATKLVPGLSWVLGILLLVLLIWFILQLLQ